MAESPLPPLEEPELATLAELLARYAVHHLDQWEVWLMETPAGAVEVRMDVTADATPGAVKISPRP